MHKNEVLQLCKYIEADVTNHGHSIDVYFTNGKRYDTVLSRNTTLYSAETEAITTIKSLFASRHKQTAHFDSKQVSYAAAYLLQLGNLFAHNDRITNPKFQYSDADIFQNYNSALCSKANPIQFFDYNFGLKGINDERELLFTLATRFKQLPEQEQSQALHVVLKTCKAIDSTLNQFAKRDVQQ